MNAIYFSIYKIHHLIYASSECAVSSVLTVHTLIECYMLYTECLSLIYPVYSHIMYSPVGIML